MSRWFFLSSVLVWNLAGGICAGEIPHLVGELASPEKIVFKGQQAFSERQLRDAVAENSSLMIAGHSLADLADYLTLLNSQIEAGYHFSGFALVEVETNYDELTNHIVVRIDEGQRYRYGEIRINGANEVVTDDGLRQYLMKSHPLNQSDADSSSMISAKKWTAPFTSSLAWIPGKPATFHKHFEKLIEAGLQSYLRELGYFDATVSVSMEPEEDQTVTLTVTLNDLGPKAILGEVEVFGCEKNTPEQVITFLDLKAETPLTSQVIAELRQKLKQSGRFLKQEVEVVSPPFDDAPSTLKISLHELEAAPPLDQPLSREQQIVLRAARWINGFNRESEDVNVEFSMTSAATAPLETSKGNGESTPIQKSFRARLSASPSKNEILFNVQVQSPPQTTVFECTFWLKPNVLVVDCHQWKISCEVPLPKRVYRLWAKMKAFPAIKTGQTSNLTFGVESKSDRNDSEAMVKFDCDPVWMLQSLAKWGESVHLSDDSLTITTTEKDLTVDAKTGRVSNLRLGDPKNGLRIEIAQGLYQPVADAHQQATQEWARLSLASKPFTTLMTHLANQSIPIAVGKSSLRPTIERWVKQDRFHNLDAIFDHQPTQHDADQYFVIPPGFEPSNRNQFPLQLFIPVVDRTVPKSSWAGMIGHEYILASMGQRTYSDAMIRSLFNADRIGPVAHLMGAHVMGSFNPVLKADLARRGLKHLAERDFRADYEPFLNDQTPLGQVLKTSVELLRDCNEQELAEIVRLASVAVDDPDVLSASLKGIAADKQTAWNEAVPTVLDTVWQSLLRNRVEQLLADCRETATAALSSVAVRVEETTVFGLKGDFKGDLLQIKSEEPEQVPAE